MTEAKFEPGPPCFFAWFLSHYSTPSLNFVEDVFLRKYCLTTSCPHNTQSQTRSSRMPPPPCKCCKHARLPSCLPTLCIMSEYMHHLVALRGKTLMLGEGPSSFCLLQILTNTFEMHERAKKRIGEGRCGFLGVLHPHNHPPTHSLLPSPVPIPCENST